MTPYLDFTSLTGVALSFDMFFKKETYQGFTEYATIEVSTDGVNWTVVEELSKHPGWELHQLDLSEFIGEDSVRIAFHYDDDGGFLYGWAIDNVTVAVPPASDAGLAELKLFPFGEVGVSVPITGTIVNNSLSPITQMEVSYSVDGGAKVSSHLQGINIEPFQSYIFNTSEPWNPPATGIYNISVEIESVNNKPDDNAVNDTLSFQVEIFPHAITLNRIDEFINTVPVLTTMATAADGLDKPTDLDFYPILSKNELWITNEQVESSGGSTLTIYNAGSAEQEYLSRTDGNAWHFMSLPTGIAFSNNFNFATSSGIQDANHGNGTFTGPTLWSSDPAIYAQPSGGNGSHLDMLHSSPYCMGIASEGENVFWVTDGWNGSVVRYDFQEDHGPGNDDHADGIVRRYTEISFLKDGTVPSHLVLDKSSGWLYVVDNGHNRVVRLDIHTGNVVADLPLINEPLAEHSEIGNVTWEVVLENLVRPSGIDIIDNRLLVGDYTSGDIMIYDTENDFAALGRITTGQPGLIGIKIAPDGSVWYANRTHNIVARAEPGEPTGIEVNAWLDKLTVDPNPTTGIVHINLPEHNIEGQVSLELADISGKIVLTKGNVTKHHSLDLTNMPDGMYLLTIWGNDFSTTRKIVLER